MEGVVCTLQSLYFYLQMFISSSPRSELRPVASAMLSISIITGTPPGYPVAALCPEILQLWLCRTSTFMFSGSSQMWSILQRASSQNCSGPGWYLSWPVCQLSHILTTTPSPAWSQLAQSMFQAARDRASPHTLALWTGSPTPTPEGCCIW